MTKMHKPRARTGRAVDAAGQRAWRSVRAGSRPTWPTPSCAVNRRARRVPASPVSTLQRASDGRDGAVHRRRSRSPACCAAAVSRSASAHARRWRIGWDSTSAACACIPTPQAAQSARAVGARAYTIGSDVVFGAGEYAPRSREGQRLIAHELTHVRQQASAPPMLQRWNIFDEIAGLVCRRQLRSQDAHAVHHRSGHEGGTIEDHSDSDNKARAIVAAWKKEQLGLQSHAEAQGAPHQGDAIGLLRRRRRDARFWIC